MHFDDNPRLSNSVITCEPDHNRKAAKPRSREEEILKDDAFRRHPSLQQQRHHFANRITTAKPQSREAAKKI